MRPRERVRAPRGGRTDEELAVPGDNTVRIARRDRHVVRALLAGGAQAAFAAPPQAVRTVAPALILIFEAQDAPRILAEESNHGR